MTEPEAGKTGDADGRRATPKSDPTMRKPAGKPGGENMPPAGGESMGPAEGDRPHPTPGEGDGD